MGIADDIVYASLLIFSIGLGPIFHRIEDPLWRQRGSALAGFLIALSVSGWHILHPFVMFVVNTLIILFVSKRLCHIVSFIFCFSYLAFFRTCHLVGFPHPPPHTNAIIMILALKMVGLAFEIRDTYYRIKDETHHGSLEFQFQNVSPSVEEMLYYSFCHAGVLTGPYYKYRTYWDSFYGPYSVNVNMVAVCLKRIAMVPFYLGLFLISRYFYPVEYAESEDILQRSIVYRFWYLTPVFFNFRMRLYTAFVLSECQCLTSGVGYYPAECKSRPGQGPVELEPLQKLKENKSLLAKTEYDYETIHNIDEYGADFVPTVREGMRCWNMTVQYWLAIFVHKRVPWKKFRVAITMLTSSYWHGVYPSYYMSLLTVPFVLMAEDVMARALRKDATPKGQKIYDWVCWVLKMQAFSYMGIAFYPISFSYWMNMYFIGHVTIVLFYILGTILIAVKRKSYKKMRQAAEGEQHGGLKKHD